MSLPSKTFAVRAREYRLGSHVPALVTKSRLLMACLILIPLVVLELITRLGGVPRVILIPPSDMVKSAMELLTSGAAFGPLAQTVKELLIALALSTVLGLLGGLALYRKPVLDVTIKPILIGMYATPVVLFYPFALVVFGLGVEPTIVIAALMGMVPTVINTTDALKGVPQVLVSICRSLGLSKLKATRYVYLPATVPILFAGFRLSFVYCYIGVIVMEFLSGGEGLGYRVNHGYEGFDLDGMYGYVVIITIIAVVAVTLLQFIENNLRKDFTAAEGEK